MEFTEKISVVMPTYNTPVSFLQEAVESILNQTFPDFEFIIVDDGSTNESVEYLNNIRDQRVRIIRNPVNIGITKSLNIGFKAAKGKYIARMDSDDISLPERFEKQYDFMESHPDVFVCGTRTAILGQQPAAVSAAVEDMESYRIRMLFANPGPEHPTAFFHHEKLLRHHIEYDEKLIYAQDYGMWMTISQVGTVYVLPDMLLYRRMHSAQISSAHRQKQIICDQMTQKKLLEKLLDNVTDEELNLHYAIAADKKSKEVISNRTSAWLDCLLAENKQRHIYDQKKFRKRIIQIKKNLIYQTFSQDMTKTQKAKLFFRYLPFSIAICEVVSIINAKISNKRKETNDA